MFSLRGLAIAVTALSGLSMVSASPIETSDVSAREVGSDLEARDVDGHLFVTVDANWQGENANFGFNVGPNFTWGPCLNLLFDFNDSISSVGPDPGFYCALYIDANCGGGAPFTVLYPGTGQVPSAYNDKISSFKCTKIDNVG